MNIPKAKFQSQIQSWTSQTFQVRLLLFLENSDWTLISLITRFVFQKESLHNLANQIFHAKRNGKIGIHLPNVLSPQYKKRYKPRGNLHPCGKFATYEPKIKHFNWQDRRKPSQNWKNPSMDLQNRNSEHFSCERDHWRRNLITWTFPKFGKSDLPKPIQFR